MKTRFAILTLILAVGPLAGATHAQIMASHLKQPKAAKPPIARKAVQASFIDRQEPLSRPEFEPVADTQDPDQQPSLADVPQKQETVRRSKDWSAKPIRDIKLDIRQSGVEVPEDLTANLKNDAVPLTNPTLKVFAWTAPNISYQPLYFEDVALERYGQTRPWAQQSFASGVHFFKSLALLPHQMHYDPFFSCDYPLGFCRPGNPAPCTYQRQYLGIRRTR